MRPTENLILAENRIKMRIRQIVLTYWNQDENKDACLQNGKKRKTAVAQVQAQKHPEKMAQEKKYYLKAA